MMSLFRNLKKAKKGAFGCGTVLIPSALVFLFFIAIMAMVATSRDGSFVACSKIMVECVDTEDDPPESLVQYAGKLMSCALETAWCDVKTIYLKATGQLQLPELPPEFTMSEEEFDKKQAEMREYLMREDVIEKSFEEHEVLLKQEAEQAAKPPSPEELLQEMKRLRLEREQFEKDQQRLREEIYQKVLKPILEKEEKASK